MNGKIAMSGAKIPDRLYFSEHTLKQNIDIYLPADKEVDGAENVTFSRKFLSKVYKGRFRETEKWCRDFGVTRKVGKWYLGDAVCSGWAGK